MLIEIELSFTDDLSEERQDAILALIDAALGDLKRRVSELADVAVEVTT